MTETLLQVEDLRVTFHTDEGSFVVTDNVSFHVNRGEIVGLVGESGCGKSVTAMSIIRLIPSPPGVIESGSVHFQGEDLFQIPVRNMRKYRGKEIAMIFQEPGEALSPLHRVGDQLVEAIRFHEDVSRKTAWETATQWMTRVGIPDAGERMYAFPFHLSGGMQQRIMIAMALMLDPNLLIADEPTTALDVTVQAQIFDLIAEMKTRHTAVLLITHDMGVVWEMCDRVMVMYASRIVEQGLLEDVFQKPSHPYTIGLLSSIPRLTGERKEMSTIPGQVPSPLEYPAGCYFHPRCPHAFERCRRETPKMTPLGNGHESACFKATEL